MKPNEIGFLSIFDVLMSGAYLTIILAHIVLKASNERVLEGIITTTLYFVIRIGVTLFKLRKDKSK